VPPGSPEGGQWTSGGAGGGGAEQGSDTEPGSTEEGRSASEGIDPAQSYTVDLEEEERRGGHAISQHVAISEDALTTRVLASGRQITARCDWFTGRAEGSFTSLNSATDLVNATLATNREAVDAVAGGEVHAAFIEARFVSRTGYEAYLPDPNSSPYIRDTNVVSVYIRQDSGSPNGFRIQSAFPRNR
jgi:Bacterial CdiA-CT RNAse A domain